MYSTIFLNKKDYSIQAISLFSFMPNIDFKLLSVNSLVNMFLIPPTFLVQQETNHHEVGNKTFSCPSSSDSEPEKEVFAAYSRKSPRSKPVQQEPEVYCRKLRSSSSGSEDMGLASHAPSLRTASFQTPSFQTPSEKVIISFLLNLVAIGS